MKKIGSELEFISRIRRDGSGTVPVNPEGLEYIQDEKFKIICLSISEKTYLACGFNSFVVKLKGPTKEIKQ